jgi:signal transduction histidine kinase/ligand-binding sensor domain-containing protein/CheY-like chemotaxis protein
MDGGFLFDHQRYNVGMTIKISLIHQVVTFTLVAFLSAISLAEVPGSLVFRKSNLSDQLSQASARQIFQDSRGFLWVLTQEGLNRFDGKENKIFRSDVNDPEAISGSVMRGVVEDSSGRLWFGTDGGGISRYIESNETFASITKGLDSMSAPFSDRVWSMSAGLDDKIWIGYKGGGFSVFDPDKRLFKHYTGHRWPQITNHAVSDILEEADGTVWIATLGNGLLRLDLGSDQMEKVGGFGDQNIVLPSERLADVYRDSRGVFWISTWDAGVVRLDAVNASSVLVHQSEDFAGRFSQELNGVNSVYENDSGEVFFATNHGLGIFDEETSRVKLVTIHEAGIDHPRVLSVFQDRTGKYWVGGYKGVYTGFKSNFYTINSSSGLSDPIVLSVTKSADNTTWIGTADGLHRMTPDGDLVNVTYSNVFTLRNSPVTSLLAEGDRLWIGSFDSGLSRVDLSTGEVQSLQHEEGDASSLSADQITAIFRDAFGNLWVGTHGGGLNVMRSGESGFVHYRSNPLDNTSLSNDIVYAIYQERNGDLWIGTEAGLNRFNYDVGNFDRFSHDRDKPGTLSSHVVYAIYEDSKSRLWIGTQGGALNMWEAVDRKSSVGKFRHFQSNIELPSSTVYAIRGDQQENLWMSTTGGITRFNFERSDFKHYTVRDGLQGNDFSLGASFRDRDGRLYFGGANGLNAFYPDRVRDNTFEPLLAITRISLVNEQVYYDKPYRELKELQLSPTDYMLGFQFAALDLNAPEKNLYRYQMVGLDKNWIDLGNKNTVDFTNLPTGQYVFRVQGSNADGVWNQHGVALNVVVNPPIYLTWWAFFVYIGTLLMLVLYTIYRQKQKEHLQLQYQAQLESDVRARTRDLRRANDKLQSAVDEIGLARMEAVEANQAKSEFLAALSHEIRTPMHGVLGMTDLLLHSGLGDRQQGFAVSAHESANELLGLIDNILDFSKIEAGKLELEETTFNLREVIENLCYLYGELAQTKNLELNLIFNADLRRQLYGDPVRLRQIMQNLLSNAIKFTKRGSVTVIIEELAREGKDLKLRFTVEDTGIGMSEDTLQRIFEAFSQADSSTTRQYGGTGLGLSIAKQLVQLMDGDLAVSSKPGVGTGMSVQLTMTESPIYTDKLSTSAFDNYYAEVVAPSPETRAMLRTQMEALSLNARECTAVEELAVHAEQERLVLVDVGCVYDNATIAQIENLAEDEKTVVLLVAPLSLQGIPGELQHLPHTVKPTRIAGLINDILGAMSHADGQGLERLSGQAPIMRFSQRVLLVEDMTANQEIARAMLESFGCSVDIAKNGDVALEMYQQETYDFILMDCQMPVMDGFEATRHIRQLESQRSGSHRIPIVALTAGKTEVEKERCYASGMDRILFKPYSTADLNGLLIQYFDSEGELEAVKPPKINTETVGDILDVKALDNIRSVEVHTGNNLLGKVFDNFKVDVESKLEELRANADNPAVLGAGAHAIKSMSLNIGAKALSEYCRHCETEWKNQVIIEAPREIEVLRGHFIDAVRALEPIVENSMDPVDS